MKYLLFLLSVLTLSCNACGLVPYNVDFGTKTPKELNVNELTSQASSLHLDPACAAGDYLIEISAGWYTDGGAVADYRVSDAQTNTFFEIRNASSTVDQTNPHTFLYHYDPTSPRPIFEGEFWYRYDRRLPIRPGTFTAPVTITVTPYSAK